MKIKTPIEFQTFNDGVCVICSVENAADPGNRPKEALKEKFRQVPYENRKTGVTRYYAAKQAGVKIAGVIRIPYLITVSSQDVCVIDGISYRIQQVQHIRDTMPASSDLTLQKLEADYDLAGTP